VIKKILNKIKLKANIYKDPAKNLNCTEFEVDNWAISRFIIDKIIPIVGVNPYPISELNLMVATLTYFKPKYIFEWGTNIGKSARIFYETMKHFNLKCDIFSIDLPDNIEHNEHPHKKRGMLVKNIKTVKLIKGDGLEESLKLCKDIDDRKNILFFLDGDHSYESVSKELSTILNFSTDLKILVHDTFYQSDKANYNIGPYKAISNTLENKKEKFKTISTNLGLPGLTLIYKS